MTVVCQELGFRGGDFTHWFDGHKNDKRVLWQKPACSGAEESVYNCDWMSRKMGSGVCGKNIIYVPVLIMMEIMTDVQA